ncbi:MAG: lysophospholipase [Atopobiaceae bacterium]|nr:lysophospholipase [Atopobiaceae bacterium]
MITKASTEHVSFLSSEGTTSINGVVWWPDKEPRAVVQLVHGMAEHIMRYEPFARYLNDQGFVVCGHDHFGHGKSVTDPSKLGQLSARYGHRTLVSNVGRMRDVMHDRMDAELPYFLFGHSMGSFVVRSYITSCGQGLAGCIICGTGHIPPMTSKVANTLAHAIARVRGEGYVSKLLDNLSVGSYAKALDHPKTPLDWLSYNRENIDAYIADNLCGFSFSAGGNAALTALTSDVCSRTSFARIPKDLPLLFVAGDADPVGAMGKGVRIAARMAREAGNVDVTCKIYEHMRHEILNETDHGVVFDDIATWMEDRI